MDLRVVDALAVSVRLQVEDPMLLALLDMLLVDLARGSGPEHYRARTVRVEGLGPWAVVSDAHTLRATSLPEALAGACAAVNLNAVAATPLLAMHCAVLCRGDRTLAVPGRSGLGKSTLTAGLLRHGWLYVSDEALAFDRTDGALVAYPRPLALSYWSAAALGITVGVRTPEDLMLRPTDLGTAVEWSPGPVTDMIFLDTARAAHPRLSTGSPHRQEALAELFHRGFTHHEDVAYALPRLADVVKSATMHGLTAGEPLPTAALLDRALC